jgi:hypothetical protein
MCLSDFGAGFSSGGDGYLLSSRADQKRGGFFFAASLESIGSIDKNNKSIAQISFEFCFVFLVFIVFRYGRCLKNDIINIY